MYRNIEEIEVPELPVIKKKVPVIKKYIPLMKNLVYFLFNLRRQVNFRKQYRNELKLREWKESLNSH